MQHEARLDQPTKDGSTAREHLTGRAERAVASGRPVPDYILADLEGPEFPEPLEYLFSWARELARTRTIGVNGPEGFTYPMIESWARLTGRRPSPLEVEALFALDAAMRFPAPDQQGAE